MAKISTIIEFKDAATSTLKKVEKGFDDLISKGRKVNKILGYLKSGDANSAGGWKSLYFGGDANQNIAKMQRYVDMINRVKQAYANAVSTIKRVGSLIPKGLDSMWTGFTKGSDWALNKLANLNIPNNLGAFSNPKGPIEHMTNGLIKAQSAMGNLITKAGGMASAFAPTVGLVMQLSGQILKATTVVQRLRAEVIKIGAGVAGSLLPSFGGLENMISRIGWKLQSLAAGIYFFKNIGNVISGALQSVDDYISSVAKINNVIGEFETLEGVQQNIYDAANRSRMGYKEMLSEVATLKMTTGDAFGDLAEATKFSEIISKAFVVSGVGAEQASSAMLQLRQGLASGVLQGDELRSILEGAPLLARMLADNLGYGNVGALKKAASEGELTTEKVIEGIMAAEEKINQMFDSVPMRWQDIMTRIGNASERGFKDIFEKISKELNDLPLDEIFKKFEELFAWIGDKNATLIDKVAAIVGAFKFDRGYAVDLIIKNFGGALTFLFGVLKGGPVGLLFQVVGALKMLGQIGGFDATNAAIDGFIGVLNNFSTTYPKILSEMVGNISDVLGKIRERMPEIMGAISNAIVSAFNAVTIHAPEFIGSIASTIIEGLRELHNNFPEIGAAASSMMQSVLDSLGLYAYDLGEALGNIAADIVLWFANNYGMLKGAADNILSGIIDGIIGSDLLGTIGKIIWDGIIQGIQDFFDPAQFQPLINRILNPPENNYRQAGLGLEQEPRKVTVQPSLEVPPLFPTSLDQIASDMGTSSGAKITTGISTELTGNMPTEVADGMNLAKTTVDSQAPAFTASGQVLGQGVGEGYKVGSQAFQTNAPADAATTAGNVLSTSPNYMLAGNALGRGLYSGWMVQHPVIVAAIRNTAISGQASIMKYTGLFYYAGYQLSAGIASGVSAGSGLVRSAVIRVVSAAAASARAAARIASPSKLFEKTIGLMMGAGIEEGLLGSIPMVERATAMLVRAIDKSAEITPKLKVEATSFDMPDKDDIEKELSQTAREEIVQNARVQYVNRFTQMHSTPSINFGDVYETADVNQIISRLATFLVEEYNADLEIIN